jgi:hypothetical protein
VAIQTLTRQLAGYRIIRRLALSTDKDYALLCEDQAGRQKLAAWTLGKPHPAGLEIRLQGQTKPAAVSGNGERFRPRLESSRLLLDLGAAPQYVTLGTATLQ